MVLEYSQTKGARIGVAIALIVFIKSEVKDMKKWTVQSATEYIKKAKEKGLTYWSAKDFLKHITNTVYNKRKD